MILQIRKHAVDQLSAWSEDNNEGSLHSFAETVALLIHKEGAFIMPTLEEILNSGPIDSKPKDSSLALLLANLQGNILKGHGRQYSVLLFLKFGSDAAAAKQWIRNSVAQSVTSAQKQFEERAEVRLTRSVGSLFVNFFLTLKGYEALLVTTAMPSDPEFEVGLRRSLGLSQEEDVKDWEPVYKGEIHAAILLAHNNKETLDGEVNRIKNAVQSFATLVTSERGKVMRNANGDSIEHFGYVDGRSQPLFLKEDVAKQQTDEPGVLLYDPSALLNLVLIEDPNDSGSFSCGSYLVFCKFEQNVHDFKVAEEKLADELGLTGLNRELAGAMIIGRFRDGTPVVLKGQGGLTNPIRNNFTYDRNNDSLKCPLHSHIRKTNPRGETVQAGKEQTVGDERNHRIVRRAVTYGERTKEPKDNPTLEELPSKGVGLLFMCFQRRIGNQFKFLQKKWANREDFLVENTGLDPLIGQKETSHPQKWPTTWGGPSTRPFLFRGFITLKGGEYFFAPSISALKKI